METDENKTDENLIVKDTPPKNPAKSKRCIKRGPLGMPRNQLPRAPLAVKQTEAKTLANIRKNARPRIDTRWRQKETKSADSLAEPMQQAGDEKHGEGSDVFDCPKYTDSETAIDSKSAEIEMTVETAASTEVVFTAKPESVAESELQQLESAETEDQIVDGPSDLESGAKKVVVEIDGPEYENEIFDHMFSTEETQLIGPEYLADQVHVTPQMRAILVNWIADLHQDFHMATETYFLAVALIDRYLHVVKNTTRSKLQLVGTTALWIASKFEDVYPPPLREFVYASNDTYTTKDFCAMEVKILRALNFELIRPVSIQFLKRFSRAADVSYTEYTMSKYFLDLATLSYTLASCKPSEIAASALFLSLNLSHCDSQVGSGFDDSLWHTTLQESSRYSPSQLRPTARQLAMLARNAAASKLKAIYKKYGKRKFLNVSLDMKLCGPLMDSLAAEDN